MSMNIGAYTACLHNYDLAEALDILKTNGLTGAEVNVGGFIPSPHCPVDTLMTSQTAREDYMGIFEDKEMRLAGLNTSGNPLSPLPDVGPRHAYDLRRAIELAIAVGHVVAERGGGAGCGGGLDDGEGKGGRGVRGASWGHVVVDDSA